MDSMEQKKQFDILAEINKNISTKYTEKKFGKYVCYINKAGVPFRVSAFPGSPALVVEYAENEQEAFWGRFEDGDRFYYDDYLTIQIMLEAIISEIDNS